VPSVRAGRRRHPHPVVDSICRVHTQTTTIRCRCSRSIIWRHPTRLVVTQPNSIVRPLYRAVRTTLVCSALAFAVLSIPSPQAHAPSIASTGEGFAWNRDGLWRDLENRYAAQGSRGCSQDEHLFSDQLPAITAAIKNLEQGPVPPTAVEAAVVEMGHDRWDVTGTPLPSLIRGACGGGGGHASATPGRADPHGRSNLRCSHTLLDGAGGRDSLRGPPAIPRWRTHVGTDRPRQRPSWKLLARRVGSRRRSIGSGLCHRVPH